ncbi:hypothetical protein Poly30_30840 [Planctomycetes bacterium Poly30]|uniref:Uncharacterized protein n=1 Tax=Saltatorellus ferox TaxID=2528018 RepID=A0A518ETZ5_9BACT|nr:hypothetical protein Poly30_30840 [Planctomycetes bacterium Poly30]
MAAAPPPGSVVSNQFEGRVTGWFSGWRIGWQRGLAKLAMVSGSSSDWLGMKPDQRFRRWKPAATRPRGFESGGALGASQRLHGGAQDRRKIGPVSGEWLSMSHPGPENLRSRWPGTRFRAISPMTERHLARSHSRPLRHRATDPAGRLADVAGRGAMENVSDASRRWDGGTPCFVPGLGSILGQLFRGRGRFAAERIEPSSRIRPLPGPVDGPRAPVPCSQSATALRKVAPHAHLQ